MMIIRRIDLQMINGESDLIGIKADKKNCGINEPIAALSKEINEAEEKKEYTYIKVKYSRKITTLKCSDIIKIKMENRITKFYTVNETYMEYKPLADIEPLLPEYFIRCNAGTIVNKNYVKSFNHTELVMKNDEVLRIGRSFKDRSLNKLIKNSGENW